MNAKQRLTVGGAVLLGMVHLVALRFLYDHQQPAVSSTAPSVGSPAVVKTKRPGVPYWADDASDWTIDTGVGLVGVSTLTGGQLVHGWYYTLHLGPVGECNLQGPMFRFRSGPHTRKTVIGLAFGLAVVGLIGIAWTHRRKRHKIFINHRY